MLKKHRKSPWWNRLKAAIVALFLVSSLVPERVTGASYTVSCEDLKNFLETANGGLLEDGDTVGVSAGTCTYTTSIAITEANFRHVTISGAGDEDGGTTINCNNTATGSEDNAGLFVFHTTANTLVEPRLKIGNMRLRQFANGACRSANGVIFIQGYAQGTELYELTIERAPGVTQGLAVGIKVQDATTGIIYDSIIRDTTGPMITMSDRYWCESPPCTVVNTGDTGNGSRTKLNLGNGYDAWYVEDNVLEATTTGFDGGSSDCDNGGRFVYRFNTIRGRNIVSHGTEQGSAAGCERVEVYENDVTTQLTNGSVVSNPGRFIHLRGAPNGPIFNNTIEWPSGVGYNFEGAVTQYRSFRSFTNNSGQWRYGKSTGQGPYDNNTYIIYHSGTYTGASRTNTTLVSTDASPVFPTAGTGLNGYGLWNLTRAGGWFHGTHRGSATGPFTIDGSNNGLTVTIDGGSSVSVTLTSGSRTTAQIIADINALLPTGTVGGDARSAKATNDGNRVRITSDRVGTSSIVAVSGTAVTTLGMVAGSYPGIDIEGTVIRWATVQGTVEQNFTITDGVNDTLSISVDGGSAQAVDLTAGTRTAAQIVSDINTQTTGLTAVTYTLGSNGNRYGNGDNRVQIASDTLGASSSLRFPTVANSAYATLGLTSYVDVTTTGVSVVGDAWRWSSAMIETTDSTTQLTFMVDGEDSSNYKTPYGFAEWDLWFEPGDEYMVLLAYPSIDMPGWKEGELLSLDDGELTPYGWPTQTASPAYFWNNTFNGDNPNPTSQTPNAQPNRDFFSTAGPDNDDCTDDPFDGSCGIGSGMRSARPMTCTDGVAYWSTDQGGDWNQLNGSANDGALDVCEDGTWDDDYYIPFDYPHSLRSSLDSLEFSIQPVKVHTGNTMTAFEVTVKNVDGTTDTASTIDITLTLSAGCAPTASISGTLTVAAVAGIATFSNVVGTGNGAACTLTASADATDSGTSNSFDIGPNRLAFTTQPGASYTSGTSITFTVTAQFASDGTTDTAATNSVAITIAPTSGSCAISGSTTQSLSAGVRAFSLTVTGAGTCNLTAANSGGAGPTSAVSDSFTVSGDNLVFTTNPASSVTSGVNFSVAVTVQLPSAATDTSVTNTVTLSISSGCIVSAPAVAAVAGVATWTNTVSVTGSGTCRLTASGSFMNSGNSSDFTISGVTPPVTGEGRARIRVRIR